MIGEKVLANGEARSLLLAGFVRARAAREMSDLTGIPIARCYRFLHRLRLLGLVAVERVHVTSRGRGKLLFRSRLQGLELFLSRGRLMARVRPSTVSESTEEG